MDPALASDLATAAEENYSGGLREGIRDYRVQRKGGVERLKDGWNREVENGVKWAQGVRLGDLVEVVEEWEEPME